MFRERKKGGTVKAMFAGFKYSSFNLINNTNISYTKFSMKTFN